MSHLFILSPLNQFEVSFLIDFICFLIPTICLTIACTGLVFLGQIKILGPKIYKITINNSFITNVIHLFILICFLFTVFNLIFYIFNYIFIIYNNISLLEYLNMVGENTNGNIQANTSNTGVQDPVRLFPSSRGAQFGIIGSAVYAYNKVKGTPKIKAVAALSALGIATGTTFYTMAIDNPIGFNSYMFSITEYFKTGSWPNLTGRANLNASNFEDILKSLDHSKNMTASPEDQNKVVTAAQDLADQLSSSKNNLLSDVNVFDYFKSLSNYTLELIARIFRAVPVEGALDDLLGQQLVILLCLFVIAFSIIILFIIYLILNIVIQNQKYILNKFDNKYIRLYLKYQIFLSKITAVYIPIFIVIGLLVLIHGIHFLITHPIPFENLGIDLHSYISSKK